MTALDVPFSNRVVGHGLCWSAWLDFRAVLKQIGEAAEILSSNFFREGRFSILPSKTILVIQKGLLSSDLQLSKSTEGEW